MVVSGLTKRGLPTMPIMFNDIDFAVGDRVYLLPTSFAGSIDKYEIDARRKEGKIVLDWRDKFPDETFKNWYDVILDNDIIVSVTPKDMRKVKKNA